LILRSIKFLWKIQRLYLKSNNSNRMRLKRPIPPDITVKADLTVATGAVPQIGDYPCRSLWSSAKPTYSLWTEKYRPNGRLYRTKFPRERKRRAWRQPFRNVKVTKAGKTKAGNQSNLKWQKKNQGRREQRTTAD